MSNTNHDFLVKNGLVVGQAITSTGTLTQAGQTFPASDGSAGQYLKTNGSGALSWGTVNTSFNITDGTTTDTVGSTETVTFTGGTNISLAVTDNTVTITNDVVDSDDITEGSSNLFYTDARAIAAIQGASNLTIDGGTLYVDTAADRVGISDTSPQQKLDVAGNIGVNGSEVIDASGNIVGSVADSAMTVGGSLAGVLSNLKVQYGTSYSGTPIQGSFFFDSLNQKLKVYTGSAFIDAVPAGSGGGGGGGATDANTTFRNYSYTLTGTTSAVSGVDDNELTAGAFIVGHKYTITSVGNTDFTAIGASANTVGVVFTATGVGSGTGQAKSTLFYDTTSSTTRVVVYVNGIKQVYGSGRDFVATTGTSVAFTYNLGSGDTVDIQVYELLTNDAYYLKSEVYTQSEVNSQISTGVSSYLPLAGGTMTGTLNVTQASTADTIKLTRGTTAHNNMIKFVTGSTDKWIVGQRNDNTDHFRFYSYGTSSDVLSIQTDGNVGIGTASPERPLHVQGEIYVNHNADNAGVKTSFRALHTSNNTIEIHQFGQSHSNGAVNQIGVSNAEQHLHLVTDSSANVDAGTSTQGIFLRSGGNVGIGTISPNFRFHAYHATTNVVGKFESGDDEAWLAIGDVSTDSYGTLIGRKSSTNTLFKVADENVNERFTILEDGKVGIGVAAPTEQLHLYKEVTSAGHHTYMKLQQYQSDLWGIGEHGSFIDFDFQDGNDNHRPQVQIGAELGNKNESDLGQVSEGRGNFVVKTTDGASPYNPAYGTAATEVFRVTYDGYINAKGAVINSKKIQSSTGTNSTNTGDIVIAASAITMTKRNHDQSRFLYSITLSHEVDGAATNTNGFVRLEYRISSLGQTSFTSLNQTITMGGMSDYSGGTNNNSFQIMFTPPNFNKNETIEMRLVFNKSHAQSVYFNQQALASQPSGTSNHALGYVLEMGL